MFHRHATGALAALLTLSVVMGGCGITRYELAAGAVTVNAAPGGPAALAPGLEPLPGTRAEVIDPDGSYSYVGPWGVMVRVTIGGSNANAPATTTRASPAVSVGSTGGATVIPDDVTLTVPEE